MSTCCYTWEYQNRSGMWTECDEDTAAGLEDAWEGTFEKVVLRRPNKVNYSFDLVEFQQINMKTSTTRSIRRICGIHKECHPDGFLDVVYETTSRRRELRFPSSWDLEPDGLLLITVEPGNEYTMVCNLLEQRGISDTIQPVIHSIDRIENLDLWEQYCVKRSQMSNHNEMRLFHGTNLDAVEGIAIDGFDWRVSGRKNGHRYGRGTYFANRASYASQFAEKDANGYKRIIITRVLVGSCCLGSAVMQKTHNGFDSSVDSLRSPSIYVTFDKFQTYPEYVVTYYFPDSLKSDDSTAKSTYRSCNIQ